MIHLGCLWFADLCWPAKKGGTATSVFCLIGLLERCADGVCQEGLWGQWPQCGSTSPYERAARSTLNTKPKHLGTTSGVLGSLGLLAACGSYSCLVS
eukprot:scaffold10594_cov162-Skeletonema_marinoi.AAC.7